MDAVYIIAVNSGRLWREGLAKLLEGTEFALHPDPDRALANSHLSANGSAQTIILYRDRGITGTAPDWIRQVRRRVPAAKIVIVTGELQLSAFRQAIDAGADGYLTDDICGRTFVRMLSLVLDGEKVVPSALAELMTRPALSGQPGRNGTDLVALSDSETDILRRVALGDSNKQIANALNLSESTVKGRVKALLRKINASNRTQAAIWGVCHGFGYEEAAPGEPPAREIAISA